MNPYLRPLWLKCDFGGCPARATWGLYNAAHSVIGRYCADHAQATLRQITERTRRDAQTGEER